MPVVKVLTPKYETVPKSARVSISASAVPAAIAGRASGNATRRRLSQPLQPSVRLTSRTKTHRSRNAARAIDRKSVVQGQSVSGRVDIGGGPLITKKKKHRTIVSRAYTFSSRLSPRQYINKI